MEERHGIWLLRGTDQQNRYVKDALDACDFPFELLVPEVRRQQGRDWIAVEWEDLSRYGADSAAVAPVRAGGGHGHDHGSSERDFGHVDVHENGDQAHGIVSFREGVLGLAWYSLKVTLHVGMVVNPLLAQEVFLSEGAHMIDFAYMTDLHRIGVYDAFHSIEEDLPEAITSIEDGVDYGHGHGWFDAGGYYSWVGEAFMGGFISAYAPTIPVTIAFEHPTDLNVGLEIRHVLTPEIDSKVEPEDDVVNPSQEPTGGDNSSDGSATYFGLGSSVVYHDFHKGIRKDVVFSSVQEAKAQGRRSCKVCKPRMV